MGVLDSIFGFTTGIFKPVTDLVDELHTSDEEKNAVRMEVARLQQAVTAKAMDYEARVLEARSDIIKAEASSSNVLASSWRPVTMYVFLFMLVWRWVGPSFGIPVVDVSESLELEFFNIIKIGLGGYIVGRSAEKIVPQVWPKKMGEQVG